MGQKSEIFKKNERYCDLVEEMREKIIIDIGRLVKDQMVTFPLFLKISNAQNINISKISKYGLIESIDINTEIIHSFDKLSLDLLAIIYESFCNYLDNTDEGISGILEDLSNKIAGRGF